VQTAPENPRFHVVFYAPWASSIVGASTAEAAAGGGEMQQFLLAKALAAAGLRVGMVMMGTREDLPASAEGVSILPQAPRHRLRGLAARIALAVGALRSTGRVRTDVVVQRNAGPTTAIVALAARITGARFVYASASVMDFEFAAFERSAMNVRLYEWGLRSASEVVVQTQQQAVLCRTRFGRTPIVIPSIGPPPRPRAGRPEAFLWVGKLQPVKRPVPYLELARALPEAEFWMIAVPDASESQDLRRAVQQAAAELPNLRLLEPRSQEAVGDLLERTVAVVNTSEREGMPNVFLEGWARGVPALALSFDPDGVIVRHGLGEFAGSDPRLFEHRAWQLWREREDQAEVAARCVAYVQAEHHEGAVLDRWLRLIAPQAVRTAVRAGSSTS
jgi:glycosyltransferase involved in cell wall biosynthesis